MLRGLVLFTNSGVVSGSLITGNPFTVLKAFVSSSGKCARSDYTYFYNKNKQTRKSKAELAEIIRRKAIAADKKKFVFDSTKTLKEHLKYSEKFYTARGQLLISLLVGYVFNFHFLK